MDFAFCVSGGFLTTSLSSSSFVGGKVCCGRSSSVVSRPTAVRVFVTPRMDTGEKGYKTGVVRNENFSKLQAGYLFPEIARRRNAFLAENPSAKIISLGIGDTTLPIPDHIRKGLEFGARKLGTAEGYTGYGAEQGNAALREKIAKNIYGGKISPEEVFVSDGAKCDISRIQMMFGPNVTSAVQDPSYPVYVDTSVMLGQTNLFNNETSQFDGITYMKCDASNNFFPDLANTPRTDLIFFCSPNNPTGAAATAAQLKQLVDFAKKNGSIIVYDAAYAPFVRSSDVPKSIMEVEGAREVAMECNSFSKYAGFTGVRLGWVVIPNELKFSDGSPVRADFNRVMTTCFNGASSISQNGGMASLDKEGLEEIDMLIDYYMENASILRKTMIDLGFKVYGGTDAPYIWVDFGAGKSSWDIFSEILQKAEVVTVPGAGFGPGGEGCVRLSAFASRESCIEACERLRKVYGS